MGDIQWYFSQVKGTAEEEIAEPDVISCLEFNKDGSLLATGDKGGRIVIFQKEQKKIDECLSSELNVYCTFQSHEPEFDYLKSLEIEEKINKIEWLQHSNPAHFLLSTNDKTVKLWRIGERSKEWEGRNLAEEEMVDPNSVTELLVPTHKSIDLTVEVSPRKIYANAHTYHINSVSVNSDEETFLSADDLRINLWHLCISDTGFNIVDLKPASMEELTEVITSAIFHPTHCNLLAYGSSRGHVRLCDMRSQALCDKHAKMYEDVGDNINSSFFSEIISSISDVRFSNDGRYLLTRDYLTLKIWDLKMENRPLETYQVHDHLRSKLCSLYENDCLFDKFEAAFSPDDKYVLTGSYNNLFRIFELQSKSNFTFEATRDYMEMPRQPLKSKRVFTQNNKKKREDVLHLDSMDFSKKILHPAWHPTAPTLAIAATNNLFIFDGVAIQPMDI